MGIMAWADTPSATLTFVSELTKTCGLILERRSGVSMRIRAYLYGGFLAGSILVPALASEEAERASVCESDLRKAIAAKSVRDITVENDGVHLIVDAKDWTP